ncbi:MAG: GerW family sporulation protein [Bacillota bacterium]|jgi:sporulation protein YtfJ
MTGHPIESLMKTTMESLKSMVDVNTVVGEPVETKDGTVIVPVSRVSFGFVAGGGDEGAQGSRGAGGSQGQEEDYGTEGDLGSMPFTGGSGAGVTVRPVGFLVVGPTKVRFIPVDNQAIYDRLLDEAPELLDKLISAVGGREGAGEIAGRVKGLLRKRDRGQERDHEAGEGHRGEGRTVIVHSDDSERRYERNGR